MWWPLNINKTYPLDLLLTANLQRNFIFTPSKLPRRKKDDKSNLFFAQLVGWPEFLIKEYMLFAPQMDRLDE